MSGDRFMSAFGTLVSRVTAANKTINFDRLYPARIVRWLSSGINPSGVVDVVFDSDDVGLAQTKLVSINAVPILPPIPGQTYRPEPGTQCLIGWQGGDESFPYATGWLGQDGVIITTQTFSQEMTLTGPLVNVVGDLSYQHLRLGTSSPSYSVVPAYAANLSGISIKGNDSFFQITFTFASVGPVTNIPAGVPFLNLTWMKQFLSTPIYFGGTKLSLASPTISGASIVGVQQINAGTYTDSILTADPS